MSLKNSPDIPPELEDFAAQIGTFMEYWGFKRVHGQIWVHLFLSNSPLDAAELMSRLGISKALVSISLKELQDFGVISEVGKSSKGTRVYKAIDDISKPILDTIRRRERRLLARVLSSYSLLSRLDDEEYRSLDISRNKLDFLGQFINLVDQGLEQLVKRRWQKLSDLFRVTSRFFPSFSQAHRLHSQSRSHPRD